MTNQDYERIYQELVGILEKNNLMWVADQVEEQIHIGKLDNIKIKTFKEIFHDDRLPLPTQGLSDSDLMPGSVAEFSIIIEYTPKERLQLLIDAIEHAVINTAKMAEEITIFFSKKTQIRSIEFRSDESTQEPFKINLQELSIHMIFIDHLKQLLNTLRKEVGSDFN